jgi:RecB family exonuclease
VGRLRKELVTAETETQRLEAAYGLARLAAEGVPGADPEQWYGILDLSTEEALVVLDGEKTVYVAPSQLDDFLKCPLHWFIKHHGGREGSFEANFGILLHKVLEETDAISEEALWDSVESKWGSLEFEATWLEKKEKRKAKAMVGRLAKYLKEQDDKDFEVIGKEVKFEFTHEDAYVSGTVDRIERDKHGNVIIVDLKTGSKSGVKIDSHPQLGLYQLAFAKNAFGDLINETDTLIGARLLYVAEDSSVMDQAPITSTETIYNTQYFLDLLQESAREMAMPTNHFIANIGSHCMSSNYAACTVQLTEAVSYVD